MLSLITLVFLFLFAAMWDRSVSFQPSVRHCFDGYPHLCTQRSKEAIMSSTRPVNRHLCMVSQSLTAFSVRRLHIGDLPRLMMLASDEFRPKCNGNVKDLLQLHLSIATLFSSKFFLPEVMAHSVLGIKDESGDLIAFVDLSLQTCDGSLDALIPLPLEKRKKKYATLGPYLCNLLVVPKHRRKGLASLLVKACFDEARSWGYDTIGLHVDSASTSALLLYISQGFQPQKKVGDIWYMKKTLSK